MPNYEKHKTFYKYSNISKESDIYHQRYHVSFFPYYNIARFNTFCKSGKAIPRQKNTNIYVHGHVKGISKIWVSSEILDMP